MAPKAAQEKAKKKAAKQKKLLMILALPMLGALVYAYMTMSGLGGKTQVAATPAASAPAGTTATAAPPDSTVTPGIAAVQINSLHSFSALGQKDPFHDHGPQDGSGTTADSQNTHCRYAVASNASHSDAVAVVECKKGNGKWALGGGKGGSSTPKPPSAPLTGAVISINGNKLALPVGAKFGHAPGLSGVWLFRLVKVTPKTALIGVVGTKQQFTLHVNRPLTLQQTGGWTYKLILEPVGTPTPMTAQPTIHDQQTP